VILEGIEKEEDLETAKSLGIPFAQGFLLGKPSPLKCEDSSITF
jgi:EAL domain-containing protein (putative c-di-GMP-specific phosphodiesterase class I)